MPSSAEIFSLLNDWHNKASALRLKFSSDWADPNALSTVRMHGHIAAISDRELVFIGDADKPPYCTLTLPLARAALDLSDDFEAFFNEAALDLSPAERGKLRAESQYDKAVSMTFPSGARCVVMLLY